MKKWSKDQDLIDALKAGDESPLSAIYSTYRNEFLLWSQSSYSTDYEQGKDVFQEALIDLYRNVQSGALVTLTSSLKTYLFQLGKYKLLNQHANQKMRVRHLNQYANELQEELLGESELDEALVNKLKRGLKMLNGSCEELISMFYFKQFGMEVIARELSLKNADSAKSKKTKCMKELLALMQEEHPKNSQP